MNLSENPIQFSVLVPVYNHAHYLPTTLNTLLAQDYPHWEALIVNDGSTDTTAQVMEEYAKRDSRFRCFHKPNGGVSTALNEGLRNAKNPWVMWLSSDDFFEPRKLSIHAEFIQRYPEIEFFHSHFHYYEDSTGVKTSPEPDWQLKLPTLKMQVFGFFRWNYVHGNSIAIKRELFTRAGMFREDLRSGQDFDMWLRMSALTPFHFVPERTCTTRWHSAMGTRVFPESGFFDSARACIDLLNTHRFDQIFPFSDLQNPQDISDALTETFNISLVHFGLLQSGVGHVPALMDRAIEWLASACPRPILEALLPQFLQVAERVAQGDFPGQLKTSILKFQTLGRQLHPYRPYDSIEAMKQNKSFIEQYGNPADAQTIQRYLEWLQKHKLI